MPRPSTSTTPARDRPARQSKLPQYLQDFEVATPLWHQQRRHQQPAAAATARFNEGAHPAHTRSTYTARSVSRISNIAADERTYIRACINNAWVKLNGYYTSLGESPLYPASIILHPGLGVSFLEANWTSTVQLTERCQATAEGIPGGMVSYPWKWRHARRDSYTLAVADDACRAEGSKQIY